MDIEERIRTNEGLVHKVAKRFRIPGVDYGDVLAAGRVGLFIAATRFDTARGTKFSTYATWWIRHHVGRWLYTNRSVVKVPIHLQERLGRSLRAGTELDAFERAALAARSVSSLHRPDGELLHEPAVHDPDIDESERLHRAIAELPEREAVAVRLLYFDGARTARAAEALRVSTTTLAKIERRALGRLAELLGAA